MSIKHDFDEYPPTHFDEHAPTPPPSASGRWWIAAVTAVIAVVGVVAFLSGQPPASARLQAANDRGAAEAQTDAALGPQIVAADAAKRGEAATQGRASATEASAQAGAVSADATAQNASATEPAPQP